MSRFAVACIFVIYGISVFVRGKLVIDVGDLDTLDAARIEAEATLVDKIVREGNCQGAKEEVRVFEYYIRENDILERETAELVTRLVETLEWIVNGTKVGMTISLRGELNCLDQEDESLISTLQTDYLDPPSSEDYNRTLITSPGPASYSHNQEEIFLDQFVFKGQVQNGFFVEAGGSDFVSGSNTLWFEMRHRWAGVLVEPNPHDYSKGVFSNRKAWGAPFCLATGTKPHYSPFSSMTIEGGMSGLVPEHDERYQEERDKGISYNLQCFPTYSLLLALGNPTVNYFSLDIEGAEFLVLQSIPWEKVDIEVMGIELEHAGKVFPGTREEIHKFLNSKDYLYVGTVGIDDMFVRKDLLATKYKVDMMAANKFKRYRFDSFEKQDSRTEEKEEL